MSWHKKAKQTCRVCVFVCSKRYFFAVGHTNTVYFHIKFNSDEIEELMNEMVKITFERCLAAKRLHIGKGNQTRRHAPCTCTHKTNACV